MNKLILIGFFMVIVVSAGVFFVGPAIGEAGISSKFDLWKKPSFFRGAAVHPYMPYGEQEGRVYLTKQDLQDLRNRGANVVSLNYPGPFKPEPPYGLDQEGLEYLDNAVNWSEEVGLYAILHFRNGPGKSEDTFGSAEGKADETLWYSEEEKTKWAQMWQFAARRYQNRPHVIAYNLMVEPHPQDPAEQEPAGADVWNDLAKRISDAIRKVDKETPIIVSATWWGNPVGFSDLKPTGDSRTIYSFHMYEPLDFTHQGFEWAGKGNAKGLVYPGMIPSDVYEETRYWDKNLLEKFLEPVLTFQRKKTHLSLWENLGAIAECRVVLLIWGIFSRYLRIRAGVILILSGAILAILTVILIMKKNQRGTGALKNPYIWNYLKSFGVRISLCLTGFDVLGLVGIFGIV